LIESIIKGIGLGLFLALSVGPVIMTVVKHSVNNGRAGGMSFVGGVWISDLLLVLVSNIFSGLVVKALLFKSAIGYVGSSFIISLGIYHIFFKKVTIKESDPDVQIIFSRKDMSKVFFSGFLINTLNPSVLLFWLLNATALATIHTVAERTVIFGISLFINMAADTAKVMLAARYRNRLTVDTISSINKISGSVLICFGLYIIYKYVFLQS
jgi:threonine/homoserine/homoserine lactone efflux protein